MARETVSYTHGATGNKPNSSLNFEANDRPDPEVFDWFWYRVIEVLNGHADELQLMVDGNRTVGEAGNADTVDGWHQQDIKDWVNANDDNTTYTAGNALNLNSGTFGVDEAAVTHDSLSGGTVSDAHHAKYSDSEAVDAVVAALNGDFEYFSGNNTIALTDNSITVAGNNVSLGGATAINHVDLTGISADDHHSRYTDQEATTAVDGADVDILGDSDTVDGYDIQKNGTDGTGIINFKT